VDIVIINGGAGEFLKPNSGMTTIRVKLYHDSLKTFV
jgi:hypothetical protein